MSKFFKRAKKFLKVDFYSDTFPTLFKYLIFKEILKKIGRESVGIVGESGDALLSFSHFPHRFRVNSLIIRGGDVGKVFAVLTPPFFQVEFLKS